MKAPGLWSFADITHPVYTRPATATRWAFTDPRFRAMQYVARGVVAKATDYPVTEPLRTEMVGHPTVTVQQDPATQNTVQTIRLRSKYAQHVDIEPIRQLAMRCFFYLRELSKGPYQPEDLRKMGHPYGYGTRPGKRGPKYTGWERLKHPRRIPTQDVRHQMGLRGSVGNRDVINWVSGTFWKGWRHSVLRWHGGVTINFWNVAKSAAGAPYPWFLFHGTRTMQAHGPWGAISERMVPRIHAAWQSATRQAQARMARGMFAMAQQTSPEQALTSTLQEGIG